MAAFSDATYFPSSCPPALGRLKPPVVAVLAVNIDDLENRRKHSIIETSDLSSLRHQGNTQQKSPALVADQLFEHAHRREVRGASFWDGIRSRLTKSC